MVIDASAERRLPNGHTGAIPAAQAPGKVVQISRAAARRAGSFDLLRRYRRSALLLDGLAAGMAALVGLLLRFGPTPHLTYVGITAVAPPLWVAVMATQRGYDHRFLGNAREERRRLADATLVLFAVVAVASFTFHGELSRGYVLAALPEAFVLSLLGRRLLRSWLFRRRLAGEGLQRVLVVGHSDAVGHLVEQLEREPWHGLVAVGTCLPTGRGDGAAVPDDVLGVPVVGDHTSILEAVRKLQIEAVAVTSHPDLYGHTLRRLAWSLEERGVDLIVSPGIVEVAGPRLSIRPVAGLSLLHLERPATSGPRMIIKGVLDRLFGITLCLLALPVMAAAALAVRLSSPGPILFRQNRIGVSSTPFEMLKFRTMVADAEARRALLADVNEGNGVLFKIRNDPRVTPVGAVLRRFSIDELPQLWNVVRGDMSLVGPRPPLPQEVAAYSEDATRRLRVRPGITGLWQVSGRSDLSWEESLRLDLRYVDNWSLTLDVSILWRTWRAVLSRNGAY
ncbi:MAG TPA: sugar transferase [Kineosporiaceae bacterium]|nr:sugar transferase [Kineosporiaceae bacterium]